MKRFEVRDNPACYTIDHNFYMVLAIRNFPGIKFLGSKYNKYGQSVFIFEAGPLGAGFIEHLIECDDILGEEIKEGD